MSMFNRIIDIQKLITAWKQIFRNRPKEGVDGVTYEEFDQNLKQYVKELHSELKEHRYESMPVKIIPLFKEERVRYIGLHCMRDKVVQNSIAMELSKLYELHLSKCCYAYRNGQSALQASETIHKKICSMDNGYVLKADIHSFFDFIRHDKLREKLRNMIPEEDVVELIFRCVCAKSVDRNGVLAEKKIGLYQGSSIAPVLSNIYMKEFDSTVENDVQFYVRYSDDMILLFDKKEEAEKYREKLGVYLEMIGLELNPDKTAVMDVAEGFEFLGYAFDHNGKTIPQKAEKQLEERLVDVWMDPKYGSIEIRLEKGREILTGWEQYYREERELGSILEYVVLTSILLKKNKFDVEEMAKKRCCFENPYKDVAEYLAGLWKSQGRMDMQLLEYEQYQQLYDPEEVLQEFESPLIKELLRTQEKYLIMSDDEHRLELIQIYSDLKQYHKAEQLMSGKGGEKSDTGSIKFDVNGEKAEIRLNLDEVGQYMEFFVGREDLYTSDILNREGRRKAEDVLEPLTPDVVKKHLSGDETIGTYLQRSNATIKFLVVDIDISKRFLLNQSDEEMMRRYLEKTLHTAAELIKELQHMGLQGHVEFSGYRGYHVWIFFEEWVPVRYANLLSDIITERFSWATKDGNIQIEYFPNKTKVNKDRRGQCIKLPLGIHPVSGKRSLFLNEDFQIYERQQDALQDFVKCSLKSVKKAISANRTAMDRENHGLVEVDFNLEGFGTLPESVRVVLQSCNLLRYLCQKARTTHYLNHFERLTVLYVFGHLGDEGKEFVHKVMSFTLNYSYQTTQKFINRCPEKPISCLKLRDQYKQISAETGCSCVFKRSKDCYPSPVLHALKKADETSQITIPMSRTMTEQKQEKIKEEISLPIKLQNIIEKIMELRKQNRAIEKCIRKYENELNEIFDENRTDSIEIKQGVLTRRKSGEKVEWIIEL